MSYMLRVRLSSFFAGAATANVLGFYLLYKDYKAAHHTISQQVRGIYEAFDGRYETLNGRITILENLKGVESATSMESSE